MVSKFLNFPDELSENDELRELELSRYDCSLISLNSLISEAEKISTRVLYTFARGITSIALSYGISKPPG